MYNKSALSLNNNLYREILSPLDQFEIRDLLSLDAPASEELGLLFLVVFCLTLQFALYIFINNPVAWTMCWPTIHKCLVRGSVKNPSNFIRRYSTKAVRRVTDTCNSCLEPLSPWFITGFTDAPQ